MVPEQHIVDLGDSGWESSNTSVGHDHLRLGIDVCRPKTTCRDSEKSKQGQDEKVSSERSWHNETQHFQAGSSIRS